LQKNSYQSLCTLLVVDFSRILVHIAHASSCVHKRSLIQCCADAHLEKRTREGFLCIQGIGLQEIAPAQKAILKTRSIPGGLEKMVYESWCHVNTEHLSHLEGRTQLSDISYDKTPELLELAERDQNFRSTYVCYHKKLLAQPFLLKVLAGGGGGGNLNQKGRAGARLFPDPRPQKKT
jgi:hypothetical protein